MEIVLVAMIAMNLFEKKSRCAGTHSFQFAYSKRKLNPHLKTINVYTKQLPPRHSHAQQADDVILHSQHPHYSFDRQCQPASQNVGPAFL